MSWWRHEDNEMYSEQVCECLCEVAAAAGSKAGRKRDGEIKRDMGCRDLRERVLLASTASSNDIGGLA